MKKFLLKYLRKDLESLMIQELMADIPKEIKSEVLELLERNEIKYRRWILWQSYIYQKRALEEPQEAQKYYNWILLLNMHLKWVNQSKIKDKEEVTGAPVIKEVAHKLEEDLAGVNDFITKKKKQ